MIKIKITKISKIIIYLCIYSLIVTSGTYAFFNYSASNDYNGLAYCNDINYTAEPIDCQSLSSTTNYLEGAKTNITVSYEKNCTIYNLVHIYLYTNETTTSPLEETPALKYKVFDGETLVKEGLIKEKGDVLIATLPLTPIPTTYTIYTWIDSELSNGQYNTMSLT